MRKSLEYIISVIIVLQFSHCKNNENNSIKTYNMNKRTIDNAGVKIEYTDSEAGDIVLFFIHGWGINHTYWDAQVNYFSKNYRVVTIDLPGFGKSGKNRETWTVNEYSQDIETVIEKLSLNNVILIGHSMSGSIAVETAIIYPSRIIGVIGIDNMKNIDFKVTPEIEKEWTSYYANMREHFKKFVADEGKSLFSTTTDSIIQKRVLKNISNSDPNIAVACLENLDKYPFAEKLKLLNQPLYLINSDYQPTDTMAFKNNHINLHLLSIKGTGHYPMIENAKQFNIHLNQAIESIKAKAGT